MNQQLDTKLIENALALCWKEYSDMWIESYCYFLLSPEFIEKYNIYYPPSINKWNWIAKDFWEAIYEYQSWNEEPLIELLQKI